MEQVFQLITLEGIGVRMMLFEECVSSTCFFTSKALGHEIRELADMAARFQHSVGRDGGAGNLNDVAHFEPVIQPQLVDSRSHPTSDRAEIIESLCTAVNFKRRQEKTPSFQHAAESVEAFLIAHVLRPVCPAEARAL